MSRQLNSVKLLPVEECCMIFGVKMLHIKSNKTETSYYENFIQNFTEFKSFSYQKCVVNCWNKLHSDEKLSFHAN